MKNNIEITFLKGNYDINIETNKGLDDLEYDLKLNEYVDKEYRINTVDDLKELFQDGVIRMTNSTGYPGDICYRCNNPIYRDDDFAKKEGRLYCRRCM